MLQEREEVLLGSSKRAARFALRGSCPAQPKAGRARPFQRSPRRGPALPPPPPGASRSGNAGLEGAVGTAPRVVAPGVTSHGRARALGAPCPRPLPAPRTPSSRPKRGSPGGRSSSLAAPSGGGRGWGAVPWAEAGAQKQGIPREGPPGVGLVQKATCSFLGCLRLLKHTYSHTPGTGYTHTWLHKPAGVGSRGCRQPQRVGC